MFNLNFQLQAVRRLSAIGQAVRLRIIQTRCAATSSETLAAVARETSADTIYTLDELVEAPLVEGFRAWGDECGPLALIAEGIDNGWKVFPQGASVDDIRFLAIIDPIDGTRPLMMDKRSGWFLSAIAPVTGRDSQGRPSAHLSDIIIACQVELPTTKQLLADTLWATRDQPGFTAERVNLTTGERRPITLRPSRAVTIEHGFAHVVKFLPGGKMAAVELEDAIYQACVGPLRQGKGIVFDDQYLSTGGQFYELTAGHDLFNADLRPIHYNSLPGGVRPLTAHPYDCCTELIARKAGCIITRPDGQPLDATLDTTTEVAWAGYANPQLHKRIAPILQAELKKMSEQRT